MKKNTIRTFRNKQFFLKNGFTLIEVACVFSLLVFLFSIGFQFYHVAQEKHKRVQAHADLQVLKTYIEAYHMLYGRYPQVASEKASEPTALYTALLPLANTLPSGSKFHAAHFTDPWGTPYGYTYHLPSEDSFHSMPSYELSCINL